MADSYRVGRAFLLGDPAQRGHADPRLLEDYEPERRAVGQITVEQALLRARDRAQVPMEDRPQLNEAAALGYRYPMLGEGPAAAGLSAADEPDRWRGEPGTRIPHTPLIGQDGPGSMLDLVRDGH